MNATAIQPPSMCKLEWSDPIGTGADVRYEAWATAAFWELRKHAGKRLFDLGFKVTRHDDGKWFAIFTPWWSRSDVQMQVDLLALEMTDFHGAASERERVARENRERAEAEESARKAERDRIYEERRTKIICDARALERKYGEFCRSKTKLRELLRYTEDYTRSPLTTEELWTLESIVNSTEAESDRLRLRSARMKAKVDWPDDEVVEAIETLTVLDVDHAAIENGMGWSKPDSSYGHWCHAMLNIDRPAAIRVARHIVGKYARTQLGRKSA